MSATSSVPNIRLSKFYFVYFASLGIFLPYWPIYLKSQGYNFVEIGQLVAMLPATKIIAPILWGWFADFTGKRIAVVRLTSLLAILLFATIYHVNSFWPMVAATLSFSFFWNAALPLFESVTLAYLHKDPHRYSLIRLWGSLGFIITVTATGIALDWYPPEILPDIAFCFLLGLWLISMVLREPQLKSAPFNKSRLRRVLCQPSIIALFCVCFLIQLSHGPYYTFYSLLLEQSGYSGTETGVLWNIGVIAEVIIFMLFPRLLGWVSLRTTILISIALSSLRWALISEYANLSYVLYFAQVLHAASFGSTHVAAVHMVHRHFGNNLQGIGQAVYASTSFGLGGMLGSFYSGWFWERYGSQYLFTGASMICMFAFLIAWTGIQDTPRNSA